jgi:phosphatidylserine/phosphatidylglycerophosphate/cardiolipin synthase-like enzyme
MKRLILAILLFLPHIHAQTAQSPDIEIVESIPVGTILDNPEIRNAHDVWLELIGHAKQSLDIEEFYISHEPGKLLEDVLAAIYSAADRGVRVRIIVDGRMYKTYPASVDSLGSTEISRHVGSILVQSEAGYNMPSISSSTAWRSS